MFTRPSTTRLHKPTSLVKPFCEELCKSFYKCKNSKWFSLLVDTGRFSRFGDEVLRFAPRKLQAENDEAEDGDSEGEGDVLA